jgi:hypothetical protein
VAQATRASWEIAYSDEFKRWFRALPSRPAERVAAALDHVASVGPGARRPLVGTIKGSRHHNMRELRRGTIRILFAFDPRNTAVMLVGGDKRGLWDRWYRDSIPRAEQHYDRHLQTTGQEHTWRTSERKTGARSAASR